MGVIVGGITAAGLASAATAASAAAGAGAAIYSATQSGKGGGGGGGSQAITDARHKLSGLDLGSKPKPAMYEPVDFNNDQIRAILANQDSLPYIKSLMNGTNSAWTADAIHRASRLIPGYMSSMQRMGTNANDLINGRMPISDIEDLVTKRAEAGNSVNVPGMNGPATLRDLGMSQLDAMNSGSGMLGKMVQMAETVSPRAGYVNPASMMINPTDRLNMDVGQHSLIQQSQQNANNLAAAPNPNDAAQAQLLVGGALMPQQNNNASMGAQLAGAANSIGAAGQQLYGVGKQAGWWGGGASTTSPGIYGNNSSYYAPPTVPSNFNWQANASGNW